MFIDCVNKDNGVGFLDVKVASILEAFVDEKQNFEPKLSSRRLPDGTMVSPKLDDMYPFLEN